jgi:hypothetical protein
MNKKKRLLRLWLIIAVFSMFGLSQNAWAATVTAIADGNWVAGGTWSTGSQPEDGDDVVIPDGFDVEITATNATNNIKSLTMNGNATLLVNDLLNVATTTNGGITLNGTSYIDFNSTDAVTIGDATLGYTGSIVMNEESEIEFNDITVISLTGSWVKAEDATITLTANPSLTLDGTASMSLPEDLTALNLLDVDKVGGTVTLSDDLALDATLDVTNGTLVVGDNDLDVTGAVTIAAGATLNANYTDEDITRIFQSTIALTGTLNSSGPRHSTGTNNDFQGAITFAATGVLNVANSIADIGAPPAAFPSGAIITATGTSLSYTSTAFDFSNGTINTNSNTDLTFATGAGNKTLPSSITDLHSLTINTAAVADEIILSADLTIAQNLTQTQGTLDATNLTINVQGDFSKGATAAAIIDLTGANVTFDGSVNFGVSDATAIVTTNATSLTFNGSGTISNFPATDGNTINSLTYNRTGETLTLLDNATAVVTFAGTTPTFNITAGTVLVNQDVQIVTTGTTTTTIGANGTLDLSTTALAAGEGLTFNGTLTGSGAILADNGAAATAPTLTVAGVYSFTGNLVTDTNTDLVFNTAASGSVDLNSSVTDLNTLTYDRTGTTLTINSDLTIHGAIDGTNFDDGTIDVNGYTLAFAGAVATAADANFILEAADSKLIFSGAVTFNATATYNIDETTDLEFQATPTLVASITECNNLNIMANGGATTVTPAAALTVHGNLDLYHETAHAATLDMTGFNLTVYGDVSVGNEGTACVLNMTNSTVRLYGQMSGGGTYTASAAVATATILEIYGTGSQFIFPYNLGATDMNSIVLNRASGAKLNRDLNLGVADELGTLTITNGDLDLNGYVIDMLYDLNEGANTLISETAGNTIINTGATVAGSNGYIEVATTVSQDARVAASGIGVVGITAGAAVDVRRYPITIPVPGIGLSTARVYQVATNLPTAITLQYDNTELNSSASDLKLYTSSTLAMTVFDDRTDDDDGNRTINENTPTGKGNVAYSSLNSTGENVALAAGHFYVLAAVPGDGGVMYTYAGADDGLWSNSSNWTPTGVPSKIDQVVIGPNTVLLNGNGAIYECKTLHLNHANATLKPNDNDPNTGDNVSLRVNGNITVAAGAEILGVNGNGRLNLLIGDGTSAGISSTITVNNDYVPTSGIWVQDFTVNAAEVPSFSNNIRVSGDIALIANSDVKLDNLELWGGYDNNQTITVPISANLELGEVTLDNDAVVTTESNITMTDKFIVKDGSSFEANDGLFSFNTGASGSPWNVEDGATLEFWDVEFNSTLNADFAPTGIVTIKGNFSQLNDDKFAPTSGTVIFENTSQKEIINTSNDGDLAFYNLEIAGGSNVVTSNNWEISGNIDVKANASLIAENGEIDLTGTAKEIMNASTQTLFFNDVTVSGTYTTEDSWKVGGDMVISGSLEATNGTITFENIQEKSINPSGTATNLKFFKLKIADGSKVTTNTNHSFYIANNATNQTGAGIEVEGTGELYVGDAASVITFDAGAGVASGYPKTITKSTDGKLEFGLITIAASPNNEVTTASDFTITAAGAAAFNNAGAGGKFTATAGEITFDGAAPVIISVSPAVTQFYSIKTIDNCTLTMTDDQEIYIAGNFTVNNQSNFAPVGTDSKLIFNGTGTQTLGGNTTVFNPVQLADVQINKTAGTELVLDIDTRINSNAAHELTLTEGILNLGDQTFTVGAGIISRHNGVIDGATGTYVINTSHVVTKLEDAYFTVNGTPTLYNLQVDAVHTTANDLTVNGELDLNTADLTIGSGADASAPVKLILNGDMTRSAGAINGDDDDSRLVLQGTGTVDGGLTNTYFTGGSNTTVQLEIGRQESLGGNLTIGDATSGYLRINSGINNLDLGTNTLTFADGALLTMLSGGIDAGNGSSVVFNNDITTIPATMFVDNEADDVTFLADMTLAGDLTLNGTITGVFSITTDDNLLTFGENAVLPAYTSTKHVIGNLRRTLDDDATVYNLGNGTVYYPVTLEFATAGSEQLVTLSIVESDPTIDRGGNPDNAVDLTYNISTEGTTPADSVKAIFQWVAAVDGGTTPTADATFPARWNQSLWTDYRDDLESFAVNSPRVLTTDEYVIEAEDLVGVWAVFNADDDTDADKDDAIDVSNNKIVITAINPEKPIVNNATKITVELQNQFGQQVTATEAFEFTISETNLFDGAFNSNADFDGVIPAGQSGITVSGLTFNTAGAENQLKIDTTGGSDNWTPTTTDLFPILESMPATQASSIDFSNVENTSMTIDWTTGGGTYDIVIMKADTLLTEEEYPVDGTTYFANTIYGAGSSLGDAVVVYNGTSTSVDVTGLAPNTTYYVYVFSFDGADGNERYRTSATSGNPNLQATSGSYDDDETFGTNNTRATSKTIGTNTPVYGTIKSSTDEDWFNFTVTSSSPNIRGTLELASGLGNYNIELYNEDNRRIRRGIRISNNNEAQVINDLPAGTYTVRIYGVEGAYNADTPYVLKVKTNADEIFSVTE